MKIFSKFLIIACVFYQTQNLHSDIPLFEGLNYTSHPVTTDHPEARRYFNQGLTFYYAFNQDLAYQSFEQAAKIDPKMAMAYWGTALALGPTLSTDLSDEKEKKAFNMIQAALKLSSPVTKCEKKYINCLATRYTNQPNPDHKALAIQYKNALKQIVDQYPDDLDAATLFAESSLDLNMDHLWNEKGEPNTGTDEIVTALESVLKRCPDHIGANHMYVHTMETSAHPQRALMSANRLAEVNPLLTHLVHSACHIYLPVGDYKAAINVSKIAIESNHKEIKKYGEGSLGKLSHNLLFLTRAYTMANQFDPAKKAADELKNVSEKLFHAKKGSFTEFNYATPLFVLMRFQAWSEILNSPPPPAQMEIATHIWKTAQTIAEASLKQTVSNQNLPFNNAKLEKLDRDYLKVLQLFLDSKLAAFKEDDTQEIDLLQKATALQDTLDDPPFNWLLIMRENLGNSLLKMNKFQEAESTFRKDLDQHPRNERSLLGLYKSLEAQKKEDDSFWIKEALDQAKSLFSL